MSRFFSDTDESSNRVSHSVIRGTQKCQSWRVRYICIWIPIRSRVDRSREDRCSVFPYFFGSIRCRSYYGGDELLRDSTIGSLTDVMYFCSFRPISIRPLSLGSILFCSIEAAEAKTPSFRLIYSIRNT